MKGTKSRALRSNGSIVVPDTRKFYTFHHFDGRLIETKAASEQEAQEYIEDCLETKIKRISSR